jgi:hypothetical protein
MRNAETVLGIIRLRRTLESRVLRKAHARFGEGRMEKCSRSNSPAAYSTSSATAEAKRRPARFGVPWRSASGPAGWFFIPQRRSSSIARTRTGVATIRSSRLTSSVIPFDRERQPGAVVAMARPFCLRPVRTR